jgi:CPA1 family monovalent cation:H+ antiporter
VEGKSLFNDGTGLVAFAVIYSLAFEDGEAAVPAVRHLFSMEAVGRGALELAAPPIRRARAATPSSGALWSRE